MNFYFYGMTYIAHPINPEQAKAEKAFLDALDVPYEVSSEKDETEHLLSTEANAKRLQSAMNDEQEGKGKTVTLDEIWK